jgi:hypothetical protein
LLLQRQLFCKLKCIHVLRVFIHIYTYSIVGRDSSVGIATRYGPDGPGIESPVGGEIFRTRPSRPWGPPSLLYNGYWNSFPVVKRPGRGVKHPPQSRAEVKEKVELYMACCRMKFTFIYSIKFIIFCAQEPIRCYFFQKAQQPLGVLDRLIIEASRSHSDTPHSVELL